MSLFVCDVEHSFVILSVSRSIPISHVITHFAICLRGDDEDSSLVYLLYILYRCSPTDTVIIERKHPYGIHFAMYCYKGVVYVAVWKEVTMTMSCSK